MDDKKPVPPALAEFAVEQMAQSGTASTPANHWSGDGEEDPHANRYDCERAALVMGDLTDDELANAVFLHGNETPDFQQVLAGKAKMPIAYLTAAKDRIRWLSRVATKALAAIASRDAVIEQRNGECVRLHGQIEDLEAQLEDTESRRENAARNASAFEASMGDLQVENGKLSDRIAELEAQVSGIRLDVITQIDAHAVTREELAALKAQQPSAGVVDAHHLLEWNRAQPDPRPIVIGREYQVAEVCAALSSSLVSAGVVLPERAAFEAWQAAETPGADLAHCGNLIGDGPSREFYRNSYVYERWVGWQARARLNPCRAQAVLDDRDQLIAEADYYRSTLRNVLKDIRDDLVRGGLPPSWSGVAETISVVLNNDRAALKAARAVAVPDGYVMVPVEPTQEMLDAVFPLTGESEGMRSRVNLRARRHYKAMIAAAHPATIAEDAPVAAVIGFYENEREPRLLSWNVLPNGEHRLYAAPSAPSIQQKESGDE